MNTMRCFIEEVNGDGDTIVSQDYYVKASSRDAFADTIARAIKEHSNRFELDGAATSISVTLVLDDTAILVTK